MRVDARSWERADVWSLDGLVDAGRAGSRPAELGPVEPGRGESERVESERVESGGAESGLIGTGCMRLVDWLDQDTLPSRYGKTKRVFELMAAAVSSALTECLASGGGDLSGAVAMHIDGRWTGADRRERISVENPANESVIATIPDGSVEDADQAVDAARTAQRAWAKQAPVERGRLVSRLADLVAVDAERLARILVAEQGKPIDQARGEVGAAEAFLRYAAENARRIRGDILPSDHISEEIHIRRVPHGVVVGLTAWNYPLALAARKLGPALVAGNAFVLLSHEFTPLSGLELAALATRAGFPPGLFNVLTGRGRLVGQALVESAKTDLVTMTGSTRAGREIYAAGADRLKVLRLELGGKAPLIVMDDADLSLAVESAVAARFANCGQVCTCNERMYLHRDIAAEFTDRFIERTRALSVGDPLHAPDLGPKISAGEVDKIASVVADGRAAGAEVLLEGGPLSTGEYARGHWFSPTVLSVSDNASPLMQQEIFGPVVPLMAVDSFEHAIELANDTEYGLSAYVYTRDHRRVMRAAASLQFGELYVNRGQGEQVQGFHTGWKQSGLGGEDGQHGFEGYLRKQTMYVNWA